MSNTKVIGNKIAEARKKINISQAELAQRLFISSQAVGKWERGESMPDITTFDRLAEILKVDLNYFSENFPSENAGSVSSSAASIDPAVKPSAASDSHRKTADKQNKLAWDMSRGNWADANFSGLENLHEKFDSSNMQRCKFNGSNLSGLLLKGNNVDSCDFSDSDISNSRIQRSNLLNNLFKDCSLRETEFTESNINGCDFSDAHFNGTEFNRSFMYGCNLSGTDFTGVTIRSGGFTGVAGKSGNLERNTIENAVWNDTSFKETQIADVIFTGTMDNCYFENCAFTRVVFQNVTLINTFFKNNKRLQRVRFIDCKADRITYEFLKQGKADLSGITLFHHWKE